ncbi:hypothetical protein L6452_01276 [Arctium lappa]|uniref:Uncharacterized protein n=1 Tax=Arctium lappa TaxID=4217 RepID=A0ACB9FFN9_ARCLA|nr:hypothetical protein L6452_01276 [Arctium lappa]
MPLIWQNQNSTSTYTHHSMPSEKLEVIKSLEPWPSDFLPDSSQPYDDQFATEVQTLGDESVMLPVDYLVVLIGNMITEEALPTYETMLNNYDGIRDDTGASASPWAGHMDTGLECGRE